MPLAWADVVERDQFKALSAEEQASAREQYFLEVVAPRVPREELAAARRQFDAETYIRKRELPAGVAPSGAGGGRGGQGGPDPDTMPLGERLAQAGAAAVRQPQVEPRPVSERRGGTRREMQPYGAGDERVAAPPPMTPGRMLEQPAPEDQRAPGLTPMEQLEGSVAPWKRDQLARTHAYYRARARFLWETAVRQRLVDVR